MCQLLTLEKMNTLNTLNEITRLLTKAQGLLDMVAAAQPKPAHGKPEQPYYTKKVEREIWRAWDKLKACGEFDARKARQIAKGEPTQKRYIDSSYSSILSRWSKEGYLIKLRGGDGPVAAVYQIPN
jgi:hypothetical protein